MLALKGQWSNTDLISVTDKQGMFPNCALTALGEILNRGDVSLIINIIKITYLCFGLDFHLACLLWYSFKTSTLKTLRVIPPCSNGRCFLAGLLVH